MANYCTNSISVGSTDSEWKEIRAAFENGRVDWVPTMDEPVFFSYKYIGCFTPWGPTPIEEYRMHALSSMYPETVFCYAYKPDFERTSTVYFCGGARMTKSEARRKLLKTCEIAMQRATVTDGCTASGVAHIVAIMPNGRVAVDGENRFGECDVLAWEEIEQVSCGNWHTVGLRKDGTLVACGSNTNGQCEVSDLPGRPVLVSCGRYHTAILLDSGKVIVRGALEEEAPFPESDPVKPLGRDAFPMSVKLRLDDSIFGWEEMNERIEEISKGDELKLKKAGRTNAIYFKVLHGSDEIGELHLRDADRLFKTLNRVKATVKSVTPLSARNKSAKYASVTVCLDYALPKNDGTVKGNYRRTPVASWPSVTFIRSVYDAVIGVTHTGEVFIDGFCPCSEKEISGFFWPGT